jgi:WXG100 family type VII secretion target
MSSLSEIRLNYNKAIQQANQLDEVAGRLLNLAGRDMESALDDVSKAWKSDSSPQFIKKGQKLETDMRTTVENLKKISSAIRAIAKRVYTAEMEAWRIANEW